MAEVAGSSVQTALENRRIRGLPIPVAPMRGPAQLRDGDLNAIAAPGLFEPRAPQAEQLAVQEAVS